MYMLALGAYYLLIIIYFKNFYDEFKNSPVGYCLSNTLCGNR
jgi:hypothetical protein